MKENKLNEASKWRFPAAKDVHFDVDVYLNRFIPPSQLHRFPRVIARFLGYREVPYKEIGNVIVAFWALVGAFLGLLLTTAVFRYSSLLQSYDPPVLFASLGATAILDYNTIQSPLAQPRASLLGHTLAATVGVCIAKLAMLGGDITNIRWIIGPLSCGVASFVMAMTNTVHPPGGATAVLAAVDPTINKMGWIFIPLLLLGSVLMTFVALAVNNIQRQFPVFWWTPQDVGIKEHPDIEYAGEVQEKNILSNVGESGFKQTIILNPDRILVPEGFSLDPEQTQVLEVLRLQLKEWEVEEEHHHFMFTGSDTTHVEQGTIP
ncbi:HPP family protein [Tothia fuscella]|uniref:HPP family protein n=1 Tax=Tothia fuscella TaxID=1048955 RepID=A0A9P4NSC6_9PEZI|nr:HPP family protein [Tothia fuscella]